MIALQPEPKKNVAVRRPDVAPAPQYPSLPGTQSHIHFISNHFKGNLNFICQ
jgi:hypothetical protein